MAVIADNIARVRERIVGACSRAGRRPEDVTLMAVTKMVEPERIQQAVDAGIRDLGENYFQEARNKISLLDPSVRWHFIGRLQTNKARYVAGHFALVHSVDTLALAQELGKRAGSAGIIQDVLVEVKLDPVLARTGVSTEEALGLASNVAQVPGVRLLGMMGMAPYSDQPESARPYFARLRSLFEQLPLRQRQILSMGMSGDFEVAIEEGSTLVRIGTGIFGPRG